MVEKITERHGSLKSIVVPRPEDRDTARLVLDFDLEEKIDELRQSMNAVILAHYYQDDDIQDIADFVGDSLDLSRRAAATEADVIVFCGVRFMAETAKILSPQKTVLLPDERAGCSLEDSCPPEKFKAWREAHPGHVALTYINSSAEVKAMSDIIVTSTNAKDIVEQIPKDQPILFAPDKYLGAYLMQVTGREMVLWPGTCIVHEQFSARELSRLASRHLEAEIIVHPESPEDVVALADHVGSTSSLIRYATESKAQTLIVATESGILHQMKKAAPDKAFLVAPGADGNCDCANCPFMKLNSLEKLYLCMINGAPRVEMDEAIRREAAHSVERMLEMSRPATVKAA